MSTIVQLADAVVSELNAEGWSLTFAARRLYRPRFEPAQLNNVQVTVVPRSLVIDASSRSDDEIDYKIDVAVQQKLQDETAETIDPLIALVGEIARHFRTRRLSAMPNALCVKVENEPVYAVDHIDELQCFTSILTLSFRIVE